MPETDFAELVAAARRGETAAAERLVKDVEPMLRRVVRLRLANSALRRVLESGDICQTILADFFANLAAGKYSISSPDALRRLLVTMALNRLASKARREAHYGGGLPDGWDKSDSSAPPDKRAADQDLASTVRARLSERERWLFDQNKVLGRPWHEIARELGGHEAALRMQLTRALLRVREELKQSGVDHVT